MSRLVSLVALVVTVVFFAGAIVLARAARLEQQSPQTQSPAPASAEELDRLLAPVALYPDQLLGQMLLCATKPAKVGALGEWLATKEGLKGTELQDAAVKSGFEAGFASLVLFPDVLNMMAGDIDWTRRVGEAFTSDRSAVFASIQRLRAKAKSAGALKTTTQQEVETRTTSEGQQVIVIEPANPQVVYVPQYNPQTVYTQPTTSTVIVQEDDDSDAVAAGLIGFGVGVAMGAAIDNDYYYGPYGWGGGYYMYDDAWDDWYDAREDARDDWADHREDFAEERGELAEERGERAREQTEQRTEQRTERQQTRQENRPETQAAREQRRTDAQQAATQARSTGTTQEARGYSEGGERVTRERSGTDSSAFSGYSSGRSERAASSRGQRSRSGGGGGGRGGGRRR